MFRLACCLLCYLVLLSSLSAAGRYGSTESCRVMNAKASKSRKLFASPNFPEKFAEQTQCTWIVKAPSGYRVRLSFKSFYLVGASMKQCTRQKLKIEDLFTGLIDGPYCGNTLPPEVVSTGQGFRVTLESNAVGMHATYKGFQIVYHLTTAPSSQRMRDSAGLWQTYRLTGNGFTLPPQTAPTPTRGPDEVDSNNNAAIDAINNEVNANKNNDKNMELNNQHEEQYLPIPDVYDTSISYRPNKKRKNPVRKKTPPVRKTVPKPRPVPGNRFRNPGSTDSSKSSPMLSGGEVAGIVIGVLIVLCIGFLIFYTVCIKRKRKNQQNNKPKSKSGNRHELRAVAIPARQAPVHKNVALPRGKVAGRTDNTSRSTHKQQHYHQPRTRPRHTRHPNQPPPSYSASGYYS
uniref:Uncharacterized protein LOC100175401 n=1 Tax=Phallusia mammillata TaxID=59560 RepID=A0A6F9DGY7_9ASCI|nr:uncharacterized protein LOC100175401 [Phallusia mammillata]